MSIPAPFSQYRYITPLLIFLSIALTAALMLLGMGSEVTLWTNWGIAGAISYVILDGISRFNLQGGSELKAFAISWPLLTAGFQFTHCYSTTYGVFYETPLQALTMMLMLSLIMSLWQKRTATLKHLLLGLLIGIASAVKPHAILWLLLVPLAGYYMRCWSVRNLLSAVTGTAFALWVVYCVRFLLQGEAVADGMFGSFSVIIEDEDYGALFHNLSLWQYIFMGFIFLLLLIYSISGPLIGVGLSMRSGSSIQLLSTLNLVIAVLLFFDVQNFMANLTLLILLFSVQFTILQANIRSIIHEWWLLVIILTFTSLCIIPIFL